MKRPKEKEERWYRRKSSGVSLAGGGGRERASSKPASYNSNSYQGPGTGSLEKCTGGRVTCARLKSEQTRRAVTQSWWRWPLRVGRGSWLAPRPRAHEPAEKVGHVRVQLFSLRPSPSAGPPARRTRLLVCSRLACGEQWRQYSTWAGSCRLLKVLDVARVGVWVYFSLGNVAIPTRLYR